MFSTVRDLDLRLLKVFIAVVENGGFSAAQAALNVGQSTISGHMIDLETRFGMRLCNRGISGFGLTEDGKVVYEVAKELFRSIDSAAARIQSQSRALSGELKIAIADALYSNPQFILDKFFNELNARCDEITISLYVANPLQVEQGILASTYHIGIHTFPSHVPGIAYETLFNEEQGLYCGKSHPLFKKKSATLEEIQQHAFVRRTYYGGTLTTGKFKPIMVKAEADCMEATAVLINSGLYLGHLPRHWARSWVDDGLFWELPHPDVRYHSTFQVVTKVSSRGSKLISVALEILLKLLQH